MHKWREKLFAIKVNQESIKKAKFELYFMDETISDLTVLVSLKSIHFLKWYLNFSGTKEIIYFQLWVAVNDQVRL